MNFAAEAAATANNRSLAYPPLPMLYSKKGEYSIGIAPYYYTGEANSIEGRQGEVAREVDQEQERLPA